MLRSGKHVCLLFLLKALFFIPTHIQHKIFTSKKHRTINHFFSCAMKNKLVLLKMKKCGFSPSIQEKSQNILPRSCSLRIAIKRNCTLRFQFCLLNRIFRENSVKSVLPNCLAKFKGFLYKKNLFI